MEAAIFPALGPRFRAVGPIALAAWALTGAVGCSSSDAMRKQVTALETQMTALRADHDRMEERLAAMELSARAPAAPARAAREEHPRLKVIQVAPGEDAAEASPVPAGEGASDGGGKRPVIRGSGDRIIKTGDGEQPGAAARLGSPLEPVAVLTAHRHGG
ncbi:MAG: hypothetical protein FJ104_09470 [Deltaproteobacteria bacterium]|nr:hypothetical protein [Deltaproteobacteria bacterium]